VVSVQSLLSLDFSHRGSWSTWKRIGREARVAVALAGAFAAVPASAAPLTAAVTVERDAGALDCPDGAELTTKVEQILQRPLADEATSGEQVRVEVRFRRQVDGYVANLRFRGPKPGERVLRDQGPGCGALSDAVSVAIGLLLDRELQRPQPADAEVPPPRATETTPPARVGRKRAPPARRMSELRGSLGGGLWWGFGDAAAPRVNGDLELRVLDTWLLGVGFIATWPAPTRFGTGEARISLLAGTLRGCGVFGDRWFVGPCVAVGVGRLHGVGVGYDEVGTDNLLWAAVGAGVVAEAPVWGPVFWGGSAELWRPLSRQTFSVQNAGTAWESPPVVGSLGLRLGVRGW